MARDTIEMFYEVCRNRPGAILSGWEPVFFIVLVKLLKNLDQLQNGLNSPLRGDFA